MTLKYSFSKASTSASSSTQLSLNRGPLMILLAIDTFGSLCSGLLQRSIVFADALVSSEHQDSHCARIVLGEPDNENSSPGVLPTTYPQPLLRKRENGNLVLCIVRQILVEVRKTVGIRRKLLIDRSKLVTNKHSSKAIKVDDIEGGDMIRFPLEMVLPKSISPELVAQCALP